MKALLDIDRTIKDQFPATLDGKTYAWGRENQAELCGQIDAAFVKAENLAARCCDHQIPEQEVTQALSEWKHLTVELFRRRDAAMRQEHA